MKPHQTSMLVPPVSGDNVGGDDRCTPPEVIAALLGFWPQGIELDPCDNPYSIVPARRKIDRVTDSLRAVWRALTVYLNPPFSNAGPFMEGAVAAAELGAEVVWLVRHDSSVAWWRTCVNPYAAALCLVDHRLRFRKGGEDTGPADHATTIGLFLPPVITMTAQRRRARMAAFVRHFAPLGLVVKPMVGGAL